ncbi:hypothetical protein PHMEG_00014787 [Phytophthora megakarya]|uniref:Uncharacterized protein n=1 Tax=Phytophthora megakarya TaxID=4795 RepID=A0A225W5F1_9STRA|nr:hypothetical protein PHMEG_00014787 [Phytophthora megakarya]
MYLACRPTQPPNCLFPESVHKARFVIDLKRQTHYKTHSFRKPSRRFYLAVLLVARPSLVYV